MSVTYEGFTVSDRVALVNATTKATELSDKAWRDHLIGTKWDQIITPAYDKWFGAVTKDRFQRVWLVVNVVNYALHSQKITWKRVAGDPNNYGSAIRPPGGWDIQSVKQIIDSGYTVEIGDAFYAGSENERYNTIIHEVSHIVANTEDEVNPATHVVSYGTTECTTLKANYPDKAINNADNYGYFHLEFL